MDTDHNNANQQNNREQPSNDNLGSSDLSKPESSTGPKSWSMQDNNDTSARDNSSASTQEQWPTAITESSRHSNSHVPSSVMPSLAISGNLSGADHENHTVQPSFNTSPQPVLMVYSPRGVEYVFQAISLIVGAIGIAFALLALVNGQFGFDVLSFPVSVLLISVPVFAWLFLKHKKAELLDPNLKQDASKRRTTQTIQIISFLVCFFTAIGFIATILSIIGGQYHLSIVKVILDVLVLEAVSGGILYYYWRDEHRGL